MLHVVIGGDADRDGGMAMRNNLLLSIYEHLSAVNYGEIGR